METVYLICFILGLVLSILSVAGGLTHLHIGHFHGSHVAHTHTHGGTHGLSSVNGFTITAFLCWFGGAGYLLNRAGIFPSAVILLFALFGDGTSPPA